MQVIITHVFLVSIKYVQTVLCMKKQTDSIKMFFYLQGFPGFGLGEGGFQMSFGIGAFPFGIFASAFNFNDGRPAPGKFRVVYIFIME